MIELLLTVVLAVIVAGVLYWAISALAGAFGLPAPVVVVLQVLVVLIIVLFLVSKLWPTITRF